VGVVRVTRARLGYIAGCTLVVIGVALTWGVPVALIVGGAIIAVTFLLLYDTDEEEGSTGGESTAEITRSTHPDDPAL